MKVKVISRNPDQYMRETSKDLHCLQRNVAPELHPLAAPREYTAALNAAKMTKIFAKPFLCALEGHRDAVEHLAKHPVKLSTVVSAAADGEIRFWDLSERKCVSSTQAHDGPIKGICFGTDPETVITAGQDQTIKRWRGSELTHSVLTKSTIMGIAHHSVENTFATAGETVNIWEEGRNEPLRTLQWGVDTVYNLAFNPIEHNILGSLSSDRSIVLYDLREASPLRKVVLAMRSNAIAFNPMRAMQFTVANEDFNLYTFDMRNLSTATQSHVDHVGAVLSLDYSPMGTEFVSGSLDKTIRIYDTEKMNSREVYHTKRMQRVTSVVYSLDSRYIMSASDEMNLRLWKSRAAEQLGFRSNREKDLQNYNETILNKFGTHRDVKKIAEHRHLPKPLFMQVREKKEMLMSRKRKEIRRRQHSKNKTRKITSAKEKIIVEEVE